MITMNLKTVRLTLATALMGLTAICAAQTSNTVVAQFGVAPEAASNFTVKLINTGTPTDVAGFAFKVIYDPAQVNLTGVSDNTGQSSAKIQYNLGAATPAEDGSGNVEKILLASTAKNLENPTNLAELKFTKAAGYAAPLKLQITDRLSGDFVDGFNNGELKNIPHSFDSSAVNR